MAKPKRIAVLLSGCGFLDGSEIHEAVLTMLALDRAGAEIACLAPRTRVAVVDHGTGQPTDETRDAFAEAARIARGKLADLATADPNDFDGLMMPGGFGAAKNLCDFAVRGADCEPEPDVARFVRAMLVARKPVGAICIAPALLAAICRGTDFHPVLTIGDDAGTAEALAQMGSVHRPTSVTGIVVDEKLRIASTPAYMFDARVGDVATGIEKCVHAVLSMA